MKKIILQILVLLLISTACNKTDKQQKLKEEIQMIEKEFEAYVKTNGIAQGFYEFADDSAVILRENDSLIKGKNNIKTYYQKAVFKRASVSWTPDFINVADDGSLAYTYGRYLWTVKDSTGELRQSAGVFHTVWKRQSNGKWKYVWD